MNFVVVVCYTKHIPQQGHIMKNRSEFTANISMQRQHVIHAWAKPSIQPRRLRSMVKRATMSLAGAVAIVATAFGPFLYHIWSI